MKLNKGREEIRKEQKESEKSWIEQEDSWRISSREREEEEPFCIHQPRLGSLMKSATSGFRTTIEILFIVIQIKEFPILECLSAMLVDWIKRDNETRLDDQFK